MQSLKPVVGLIGTVLAILYCGGLLYYFIDGSGSVEEAQAIGLGPTLLGLGAIGALFCIALIVKVILAFGRASSGGSGRRAGSDASTQDGEGAFDADAVLARYMATRSPEAAASPAAPPAHQVGGPAARPSFGRKIR